MTARKGPGKSFHVRLPRKVYYDLLALCADSGVEPVELVRQMCAGLSECKTDSEFHRRIVRVLRAART